MNQSRLLGNLEMTHSRIMNNNNREDEQDKQQQEELYKTLANNARNSYVANKKGKKQQVKLQDVKYNKKNKIWHQKSQFLINDLSVSKLPNYHILMVQNVSENNVTCFSCEAFNYNKKQSFVVVQDPCRLIFYKKGTQQILYAFNFDTLDVQLRQNFSVSPQFLLIAQSLILKITHQSNKILKNWYDQLQKGINQSCGKKFQMKQIIKKNPKSFYQNLFCTEDQFTTNCQTGDILLFQDEHFFAKAQRFILNADYDHVAMIIRDKKYGILMFEANSMSGVSLTPWSCMIKYGWYKYIKRIVWRKLQNVQRTKFFQGIIHKFVKQNLKAKYYISIQKLMSNQSYIGKNEQQKGFFCSQLIAKMYKSLQILTIDKNSANYISSNHIYPYHFSQKYDLKLENGNLSRQYEINFHDEMLKKQYGENFIQ